MDTKALLYGIIGFLLGGLVVSAAVTQLNTNDPSGSMTMSQMSEDLRGKTGDDFDQAFLSGMIEHHQGAIDMAELAKENAKHDEIKKLADDILSAQSKEIDMMQAWQADWGYGTTSQSHDTMMRH